MLGTPKLLKTWSGRLDSNPRRPAWEIAVQLKIKDIASNGVQLRRQKLPQFQRPAPKLLLNGAVMEQSLTRTRGNVPRPRAALYIQVSTKENQGASDHRRQLQRFCECQGWAIVAVYEEQDSVGDGDATQFRRMLRDAATRPWDLVVFWALDRFTREGALATLKYLALLESYGVHWRSYTEPWIDSVGPHRGVVASLLASLARQERIRIQERTRAGLEFARQKGTKSGNPIGRPKAVFDRGQAVELRKAGWSWGRIARQLGTSVASVRRACNALSESQ